MTRKSPAFSFYPDSWFGGTLLMSPQCKAAYIDLLAIQWLKGPFTLDDALLACRGVNATDVQTVLDEKFSQKDGRFQNNRLESERQKQLARVAAGSKGGSKRQANAKQNSSKRASKTGSKSLGSDSDSVSDSVSVSKPKEKPPKPPLDEWRIPDGWDCPRLRQSLDEFERMRIDIKHPIRSKHRTSGSFTRFDNVEHLIYALEFCVENDYRGLKTEYRPPKNPTQPESRVPTDQDLADWQPTGMA